MILTINKFLNKLIVSLLFVSLTWLVSDMKGSVAALCFGVFILSFRR